MWVKRILYSSRDRSLSKKADLPPPLPLTNIIRGGVPRRSVGQGPRQVCVRVLLGGIVSKRQGRAFRTIELQFPPVRHLIVRFYCNCFPNKAANNSGRLISLYYYAFAGVVEDVSARVYTR